MAARRSGRGPGVSKPGARGAITARLGRYVRNRREREATAERTSAALQVLKQQGRATGGVAPYGFQFIDGRRAWHQGEQETLAAIIEHRAAGLSWAKVADKLSATGHRTRTRRPLDTPGRPPGPPGARSRARAGSVETHALTISAAPAATASIPAVRRRVVAAALTPSAIASRHVPSTQSTFGLLQSL